MISNLIPPLYIVKFFFTCSKYISFFFTCQEKI
nr:MAG TPA: hypothetical protein [Caudoviricetes sp.]